MNMLQAIYDLNKKDHEQNWNGNYTDIKVWEDDPEWKDIKPANWDD